MPGHRDYIVDVTMEIDAVALSGKRIWSRSGGKVANPEELAKAVEGAFRERPIGRKFILRETKVSAVHPSFNVIAEIARVATRTLSAPSRRRAGDARPRKKPTAE